MDAKELAGKGCGRRYEKEYLNKYRDCMLFYCDGKVRFDLYFYVEVACLVYCVLDSLSTDWSITFYEPFDRLVV